MAKRQKPANPPTPTVDQFGKYSQAWEYYNQKLFDGELSPCLLNFSRHKKRGAYGFFAAKKWHKGDEVIHEISLCPETLSLGALEMMQTLVHEMVHQWQEDHGSPSRNGYHNAEWAAKMCSIGLIPTDTGEPGGKQTGQKIVDYPEVDGAFIKAFVAMPPEYLIPWLSGAGEAAPPKPPKQPPQIFKYACGCGNEFKSKSDELDVTCNQCDEVFEIEVKEPKEDD